MSLQGYSLSCLKADDDQGSFLMSGSRQTLHPSSRKARRRIQVTTGSQPYVPQKVIRQILLETISKNMQDQQVTGENQRGFTKGELCLM